MLPWAVEKECPAVTGLGVGELISCLSALSAELEARLPGLEADFQKRCLAPKGRPHQGNLDDLILHLGDLYLRYAAVAPVRQDNVGRKHLVPGFKDLLRSTWRVLPQGSRPASENRFLKRAQDNAGTLVAMMAEKAAIMDDKK